MMKPEQTRKLIGGLALIFGLWWLWTMAFPIIIGVVRPVDFEIFHLLFSLVFALFIMAPGIIAVVFGARLFREMRETYVQWVVGVFAVFFAFFIYSKAGSALPAFLPEELQKSALFFVTSLIAAIGYLFVTRFLLRHFTGGDRPLRGLLSRGVLILLALQLWGVLSQISLEYPPVGAGDKNTVWKIFGVVVPLAVATGSYRIAVRTLTRPRRRRSSKPA